MSTKYPPGKTPGTNDYIMAMIPIILLAFMITLVIIFREEAAVLGVIIGVIEIFIAAGGISKKLRKRYVKFFMAFPFKRISITLSFALNIILIGVILLSNFHISLLPHTGQIEQKPSPTSSIASAATAGALATAQAQLSAKATAIALQNIYIQATSGIPTITDPLSAQDSLTWDTYHEPSGSCVFQNGAYYAIATAGNSTSCEATLTNFSDLALQAKITDIHDNGGLIFRSNVQENSFYAFCVTADGKYLVEKSSPSSDTQDYITLISGNSSAIMRGANQSNLLTVITHGTIIYLYVNKHYVNIEVDDNSYVSGAIGVFTNSIGTNPTEAAFKDLTVWKL
jgi:hypothetical protein